MGCGIRRYSYDEKTYLKISPLYGVPMFLGECCQVIGCVGVSFLLNYWYKGGIVRSALIDKLVQSATAISWLSLFLYPLITWRMHYSSSLLIWAFIFLSVVAGNATLSGYLLLQYRDNGGCPGFSTNHQLNTRSDCDQPKHESRPLNPCETLHMYAISNLAACGLAVVAFSLLNFQAGIRKFQRCQDERMFTRRADLCDETAATTAANTEANRNIKGGEAV